MLVEPRAFVLDYLVRIYLIRFVAVFVLALIAVRFAARLLKQLAQAAERLGRNIHRPPLAVSEPRRAIDIHSLLCGFADDFVEMGMQVSVTGSAVKPVEGYPRNLKRCLQDLVENAVRNGEHVTIRIDDREHELRVTVSDDGPGIHGEGLLERVFEPYVRLGARASTETDADAGSGLGLTIARSHARWRWCTAVRWCCVIVMPAGSMRC